MITGYKNLIDALLSAPRERPFLTICREDENYTVTFGEFIDSARSHAAWLAANGLRSEDRAILILPQGIPLMAAFVGAMMLGAVPAILAYPNFKVDVAKYSFGLSGVSENLKAQLIVADDAFLAEIAKQVALPSNNRIVVLREPVLGPTSFVDVTITEDSLAFIQHSAGTTGLQKGVALSHRSVLTQLEHLATALEIDSTDRIYSWLPLYHDMGLIACFMLPMVFHLPVVMQSPIEWVLRPEKMLQLISDYRCSLAWVPNFALQFLARRAAAREDNLFDLTSLRALINCSEPVRARSLDEFCSAFSAYGFSAQSSKSSYAMAENVFAVTQSSMSEAPRRLWISARHFWDQHVAVPIPANAADGLCLVSSGQCLAGNEVLIGDADGSPLNEGNVGEILIRSDSLFSGYYNRPDLTSEVLQDGWYRSGDLGFLYDGELYVIGRKKDLIIVAGRNLYPQDIEEIVSNHPAIHDGRAVAFGLWNPELGTEDIVVVAETQSQETVHGEGTAEVEADLRNRISAELDVTPRVIYLEPAKWIVKSTAGKPARSATREKVLVHHPELVGTGREFLFELVSESVMTRSFEGRIDFWNHRAEELYGFTKNEAVGRVSHELLQTQFPVPLEEIESELMSNGRWEGKLVHTRRDGGEVLVESRWVLPDREKSRPVVEINRRPSRS